MNTVTHAAVRRDIARFKQALQYFPVGSRARAYVDRALPKPLVVALTRVFGRSYRRVATAWS